MKTINKDSASRVQRSLLQFAFPFGQRFPIAETQPILCKYRIIVIIAVFLFGFSMTKAQCTHPNTAFQSGEFLTYNLYYNWKFVWVKAGTASMSIVKSVYKGDNAFRCSLTTRGNGKLDNYFIMRDTLLCYTTTELTPLYFRKGAREGGKYRVDEVWYTYPQGKSHVKMRRMNNDGKNTYKTETTSECVSDMMSLFMRARNMNLGAWKKGQLVLLPVADGKGVDKGQLLFQGKETIKGDDGHKYRCLVLTYSEWNDKKKNYKKIATFYVSDDSNHLPIRIDLSLNFGSAKAFLVSMKGLRNTVGARVK